MKLTLLGVLFISLDLRNRILGSVYLLIKQ
ncbi:MAG: hypothetical protein ACI8XX_001959 [Polaribacter sp.]